VKCQKFDEVSALNAGNYNTCRIKSKEDFIATREMFPVASGRLKTLLTRLVGDSVSYYLLDPEFDFWVAMPKLELTPDPNGGAVRAFDICHQCGRYSELVWGKAPFKLPSSFEVAYFHLENKLGMTPVWVVAEPIARALLEVTPKLRGIVFDVLKTME
jgi:hypothetical protein